MGVEWSPRRLAHPVEWFVLVPGRPAPVAVIRRVKIEGRVCFRAVTWAKESHERRLIGYYPDGDAAAAAVWSGYVESRRTQHDRASRTHGGRERNARPAPIVDGPRAEPEGWAPGDPRPSRRSEPWPSP